MEAFSAQVGSSRERDTHNIGDALMPLPRFVLLGFLACSDAFTLGSGPRRLGVQHRHRTVAMGLFDGLKAAFTNEEFKEDDQRVRASHILVKGDDDIERCAALCTSSAPQPEP